MKAYLILITLIITCFVSNAQSTFEREKEIKLSGKYFYGEGIDTNSIKAKSSAFIDLISKVNAEMMAKDASSKGLDSSLISKVTSYLIGSYGNATKQIAFVEKASLFESPQTGPMSAKPVPNSTASLPLSATSNLTHAVDGVVDRILANRSFSSIKEMLAEEAALNKIGFVTKPSLVSNEQDCYILVIDRTTNMLSSLLSKGLTRLDYVSGETVVNYKTKFEQKTLIWLYVY